MERNTVTIGFYNFWNGYRGDTKLFEFLTSTLFTLVKDRANIRVLDDSDLEKVQPDIGISSLFYANPVGGRIKIGFIGENWPHHIQRLKLQCHFLISHLHGNLIDNCHNLTWPLFGIYFDLFQLSNEAKAKRIKVNGPKTKFCCFIVSNPNGTIRNKIFQELNKIKHIESSGKHWNNSGFIVAGGHSESTIINYISDFKFCICSENSEDGGYCTEKIVQCMIAGTIPIYWGDPQITKYFREESFIRVKSEKDISSAIQRVIRLDKDESEYNEVLKESWIQSDFFDMMGDHQIHKFGELIYSRLLS